MPLYVEYKVSVLVEVDLADEAVVGVYVDDEHVEGRPTYLRIVAYEIHPRTVRPL